MMPHVHLSLQSGDNMILKRMKRRHSRELAIDLVNRLQSARPEIVIGADIIAGFPTEDDDMFANSLNLITECNIVHGHIFPYSAKNGTPASNMPQVDAATIKARAKKLRAAIGAQHANWQESLIGSVQKIAVEKGGFSGHAENFAYVIFDKIAAEGSIISAKVTCIKDSKLHAELVS
jgi:threonylcarbamoyladenosine tRNA methylthiotransferase MtaB